MKNGASNLLVRIPELQMTRLLTTLYDGLHIVQLCDAEKINYSSKVLNSLSPPKAENP